jgi:hypothetical protein
MDSIVSHKRKILFNLYAYVHKWSHSMRLRSTQAKLRIYSKHCGTTPADACTLQDISLPMTRPFIHDKAYETVSSQVIHPEKY